MNTEGRKWSGVQWLGMDRIPVEGKYQESGERAELKLRPVSGVRCDDEKIVRIDCLGTVIRGRTLQFEFDFLPDAHSDQDVAGSDPLPVGDIALMTGSH